MTPSREELLAEVERRGLKLPEMNALETLGSNTGSLYRGLTNRGIGIIQSLDDLTGNNILSPEARKASQRATQKLRKDGEGTGALGFIGEMAGDPLSWMNPTQSLLRNGAIMGGASALTDASAVDKEGFARGKDALGGAAFGTLGAAAIKGGSKLLKPFEKQAGELGRLAQIAEREGIDLTPAQKTGSKILRGIETGFAELPLTAGKQAKIAEAQGKQFNQAVLKRAGINADSASPQVIATAKRNLGDQFQKIASRNIVDVDNDLLNALGKVEQEANKRLGPDVAKPIISVIDDVLDSGGTIDGTTYQNTRSMLGQMAQGSKDSFSAGLMKDLRNALDEAAERSINPRDAGAWKAARKKYGAYKTIEKAMNSTGQNTMAGNVSPAALASAAKSGNPAFAAGAGELNDLSRTGAAFLRDPVGNSGTANRLLYQGLMTGGAALGGGVGYGEGGVTGGVGGVAATLALPFALQKGYGSKLAQKYLTDGLANIPQKALSQAAATTGTQLGKAVDRSEPARPNREAILQELKRRGIEPQAKANITEPPMKAPIAAAALAMSPMNEAPPQMAPLTQRVMMQESRGDQSAISPKGAIGAMQIMPKTAPEAAKLAGLPYDPKRLKEDKEYNLALGEAYLNHMLQTFDGNEALALIAYNWGPGNAKMWLKGGADPKKLPKETRQYIFNILGKPA